MRPLTTLVASLKKPSGRLPETLGPCSETQQTLGSHEVDVKNLKKVISMLSLFFHGKLFLKPIPCSLLTAATKEKDGNAVDSGGVGSKVIFK